MIPIIAHGSAGNRGYTFDNFESNFINICTEHRQDGSALAFALILYDFTQPQVSKVLQDPDYWAALDKISAHYLTVFSFHTIASRKPKGRITRSSGNNELAFMISIDANEFRDGRSVLEKYFNLERTLTLPAILFFQVSDAEIVGTNLVQLTEEKIEDSFIEIKNIISAAADAVSDVKEENFQNSPEVFDLIERRLRDRGIVVFVKKVFKPIKTIKELFSLMS
jgi:hypothetical protein